MHKEEAIFGTAQIEQRRKEIWETYNRIAPLRKRWISRNSYFYKKLSAFLRFIVEPGSSLALYRSELGQVLHAMAPAKGVGVEICSAMVEQAAKTHPQYLFINADPESVKLPQEYDYHIFNTLGDLVDVTNAFDNIRRYSSSRSRLIVINYNFLWYPLYSLAQKVGWKYPQPSQNWFSSGLITNLLHLSGFETIKVYHQILMPFYLPFVSEFINNWLAKIPLVNRLCFLEVLVAKPVMTPVVETERGDKPLSKETREPQYTVSVIIPCKDEAGNIENAVRRIPEMGKGTEIIFCDDKSVDGTADEVRKAIQQYPEKNISLVDGPGINKAKNVWTGFDVAQGDILMILDADLTVIPEELPKFYDALAKGHGEFVNGTRMIYPMQDQAMRTLNIIGNKCFSICFSYLLGQRITDTLCGTKVFWRHDWSSIKQYIGTWGVEDRWGDYDLLFGAAKLHLKIVEVPVHYMERLYGETKMNKRFKNGVNMLRMCLGALRKFKFI